MDAFSHRPPPGSQNNTTTYLTPSLAPSSSRACFPRAASLTAPRRTLIKSSKLRATEANITATLNPALWDWITICILPADQTNARSTRIWRAGLPSASHWRMKTDAHDGEGFESGQLHSTLPNFPSPLVSARLVRGKQACGPASLDDSSSSAREATCSVASQDGANANFHCPGFCSFPETRNAVKLTKHRELICRWANDSKGWGPVPTSTS